MKNAEIDIKPYRGDGSFSAQHLASATAKATERHKKKLKCLPHPATGERNYTPDEEEFLVKIVDFQKTTGQKFLSHTQYLAIVRELGYVKAN